MPGNVKQEMDPTSDHQERRRLSSEANIRVSRRKTAVASQRNEGTQGSLPEPADLVSRWPWTMLPLPQGAWCAASRPALPLCRPARPPGLA